MQLRLTAIPVADSGASPISQTISVKIAHSIVYVGTSGSVLEFFDGNTGTPNVTIAGSNTNFGSLFAGGVAVDGNDTLFTFAEFSNLVEAFPALTNGTLPLPR